MRHGPHEHPHGWRHGHHRWRERTLRQLLFRGAFAAIVLSSAMTFLVTRLLSKVSHGPVLVPVGIGVAMFSLWMVSAVLSRRVARPLRSLVDMARQIGAGDLQARAKLGWHGFVEVRVLADAMRDMAERLAAQLSDQRALLAGASHELRTPLQHMKLLTELMRTHTDGTAREKTIADLEREIEDVDALVGKLLASSRLDFDKVERIDVSALDLAQRALERLHMDVALLDVHGKELRFSGDPTLLVRALENLLENARDHGHGVRALKIERTVDRLSFTVEDSGPGLPKGEEDKVFEPFFHRVNAAADASAGATQRGSLGLGLHLVRRIAQAHGGDAYATNREGGGAAVGFFVRVV